ncbi:MAG: adenosylcobinamide-phosphate synthase CbiB [Oscillospiraceae bacterium]|nr:adenosylcobinamide-phosphate synthase CbiB [Oscillospiraceae bacterium]
MDFFINHSGLCAILAGFGMDLLWGDPRWIPHPVVLIGKLISALERVLRRVLPATKSGERLAGGLLWLLTAAASTAAPWLMLRLCAQVNPWLRLAVESGMCWLILAAKSLKTESMRVYTALESGDIHASRRAVSMIVGRDTAELDGAAVTRAAVETVAENTSDGVIAPLFYLALGGAPLGFLYKAVNTMDSMLGYVEEPYRHIGLVPAKLDDLFNFIPARISALLMLAAGALLGMDVKNGWRIFRRDRYSHASPNSAQTESVCAGLLGLRLAGDASYHGQLHKKPFIGDPLRPIEHRDIPRACRLMYGTALLALVLIAAVRLLMA